MPRDREGVHWRLQGAALELFAQRGYDQVTTAEIATKAGVTERTFFRHFPDKREILFSGSDLLKAELVGKLLEAPDVSQPLTAVLKVLSNFDWETVAPRELLRLRQTIIRSSPDLVERDLGKFMSIAVGLTDALMRRGVGADAAYLAPRVGIQCFVMAFSRWLEEENKADLQTLCQDVSSLLSTLDQRVKVTDSAV